MSEPDLGALDDLRRRARPIEPGPPQRREMLASVDDHVQRWLEGLPDLPGYVADDEAAVAALRRAPVPEQPRPLDEVLSAVAEGVDRVGVNESSGSFFGFIPGSGGYVGALADYHAAVLNRYSGVHYAAPGAVRLGRDCLDWLAGVLGYPPDCGGDITSGGSIATLSAVIAARDAHAVGRPDLPGGSEVSRAVVYCSTQTHHAVDKALRIAGLAGAHRREIALDERYRMRTDALARAVTADREAGLAPFLVVASAGATDTGAVDPLSALADLAGEQGLWLHVDAAYGGAFALTEHGAAVLRGIERADSLVVDPHKGFFLPFGTGVVLVRDPAHLTDALSGTAGYLEDAMSAEPERVLSPSEMSPELTRPFRALRWWMSLQVAGVDAHRAALEEKLLLARHARRLIAAIDGFEVGPEPDLSVFTFRHVAAADPDAFNRTLVERLNADGRLYVSATLLDGRYTLRFAVLNARTHLEHVETAARVIAEVAAGSTDTVGAGGAGGAAAG